MIEVFVKWSNMYIMLYSSEYQIMTYFSAMLCQNIVPWKKQKQNENNISLD